MCEITFKAFDLNEMTLIVNLKVDIGPMLDHLYGYCSVSAAKYHYSVPFSSQDMPGVY